MAIEPDRRDDPRQQRDRADLRHVGRQHDDAGAHHVHRDDERELHQVHLLFCLSHTASPSFPLRGSFPNHVGVELDATVHLLLVHALHFVVEAGEAVERFLERREVVEHRLGSRSPSARRERCTPMPGG